MARDEWHIRIETTGLLTASERNFRARTTLHALEGDDEVFAKSWTAVVPRDQV
jgi:hypothetical protein